ncbi:MAG TPA: protein YgfX [Gammaproteobacteria bacterium]|jgi:hypothetical protein|nr:protein YgfX [Gammaproteobacteria bacterium]
MQNHEFNLHSSRIYGSFLVAMLLGSAIIVLTLPLAIWLRTLILSALIVYGALVFNRHVLLRASDSIIRLCRLDRERWQLTTRAGAVDANLRGDSTVTAFVSVLRFEDVSGKRLLPCIIFRDSMTADKYRQLISNIRAG